MKLNEIINCKNWLIVIGFLRKDASHMKSNGKLYNRPDPYAVIYFRHNSLHLSIVLGNILFCEAEGNYTNVYLKGEKRLLVVCKRLYFFRRKFKNYNVFYRCHKSYIINLDEVRSFCTENKKKILKISDYSIPVSRGKLNELSQLLTEKGLKEAEK